MSVEIANTTSINSAVGSVNTQEGPTDMSIRLTPHIIIDSPRDTTVGMQSDLKFQTLYDRNSKSSPAIETSYFSLDTAFMPESLTDQNKDEIIDYEEEDLEDSEVNIVLPQVEPTERIVKIQQIRSELTKKARDGIQAPSTNDQETAIQTVGESAWITQQKQYVRAKAQQQPVPTVQEARELTDSNDALETQKDRILKIETQTDANRGGKEPVVPTAESSEFITPSESTELKNEASPEPKDDAEINQSTSIEELVSRNVPLTPELLENIQAIAERDQDADRLRVAQAVAIGAVLLEESLKNGGEGIHCADIAKLMPTKPGNMISFIRKQLRLPNTEAQYDAFKLKLAKSGIVSSVSEITQAAMTATDYAPAVRLTKDLTTIEVTPLDREQATASGNESLVISQSTL